MNHQRARSANPAKAERSAAGDGSLGLALTAIMEESATLAESLPDLIELLCKEIGWDLGEAWLAVPSLGLVQWSGVWNPSPLVTDRWLQASQGLAVPAGRGLIGRVWESGEPEWLSGIGQSETFLRAPFAAEIGLKTACAFSLRIEGEVMGVIGLFKRELEEPRDDQLLSRLSTIGRQVGAHARANERAHRSERYFRELTEWASDILAVLSLDGTIQYENEAVEHILGYQKTERIGRSVFDFIHPDDIPATFDAIQAGLQSGNSTQRIELRVRHRDGSWVWLESVGTIRHDASGAMMIVASRDVTERRRLQASLTSFASRTRRIVNNAPVALFEFDRHGVYSLSEGGALQVLGREPGEAVGEVISQVYEDVPSIPQIVNLALTGESVSAELRVRGRWFHTTCDPIYDDEGVISGAGGVAVDINDLKTRQVSLEKQIELLEMANLGFSRDEILNKLAQALEDSIEDSVCAVWSVNRSKNRLQLLAGPSLPDAAIGPLKKGVPLEPWLDAWRTGEAPSVAVAEITSAAPWSAALGQVGALGFVHLWSLPIHENDTDVFAAIDVYHAVSERPLGVPGTVSARLRADRPCTHPATNRRRPPGRA